MKWKGLLVALAVVCLFLGCRRSTTYTGKDGTRATVTETGKGSQITIEGKDGVKMQMSGEGGLALPDGFPKDVPIYPGATVTMSMNVKEGVHVMLKTADPAGKVADFYKEKLKAGGWEIETSVNTEDCSMVVATNRESGGSVVSLTVRTEE